MRLNTRNRSRMKKRKSAVVLIHEEPVLQLVHITKMDILIVYG